MQFFRKSACSINQSLTKKLIRLLFLYFIFVFFVINIHKHGPLLAKVSSPLIDKLITPKPLLAATVLWITLPNKATWLINLVMNGLSAGFVRTPRNNKAIY